MGILPMGNMKLLAASAAALGLTVFAVNDALAAQLGNSKLGQRDEQLVDQAQQSGKSRMNPRRKTRRKAWPVLSGPRLKRNVALSR